MCKRNISKCITWGGGINLIATEGTIESGIYANVFRKFGIKIDSPGRSQYENLRYFIEAVKQNVIDAEVLRRFHDFVMRFEGDAVILGCTEIPVLYGECLRNNFVFRKEIFDPLQSAINILVKNHR